MFDVCEEHEWAEQQAAGVLNAGRRPERFRVRVTDLPEQLVLPDVLYSPPRSEWLVMALGLYRSCRHRDFLPWEAVDYVLVQLDEAERAVRDQGHRLTAATIGEASAWVANWWRPVVERWRAAGAASEDRVSRLLKVVR